MAATILQGKFMEINSLVERLRLAFPKFTFVAATEACWSPEVQKIYYDADPHKKTNAWGLLHELGHAILGHGSYATDIDLLQKEAAAWVEAESVAKKFGIIIDEEYAQSCLETYRDWLYKRSTCPECEAHGIQSESRQYYCLNCRTRWNVSTSRFCRPYRGKAISGSTKKSQKDSSWLFVESRI